MNLLIVLIQGYEDAIKINPYNSIGYGALVFALCVAVVMLWRKNESLLAENKAQVEMMLKINGESIPILTNVITALNNHEGLNKDLKDGLDKLARDHKAQLSLLERIQDA